MPGARRALVANNSGIIVVAARIATAHLTVTADAALGLLAVFTLASLAWAAVGTAAFIAVPTADAAFPVLGLTALPVLAQSGTFGAIGALLPWLATLPRYLPAQPVIDAVTQVLQHTSGGLAPIPPPDAATLAAWAVAGLLVSARFFRWNPRRPAMPAAPIQPRNSIPPAQRLVAGTRPHEPSIWPAIRPDSRTRADVLRAPARICLLVQ